MPSKESGDGIVLEGYRSAGDCIEGAKLPGPGPAAGDQAALLSSGARLRWLTKSSAFPGRK